MCGFAGVLTSEQESVSEHLLQAMVRVLAHRGPDDCGFYRDLHLGLVNSRLSILDLSQLGHLPMGNEAGDIWVAYNGEIYNFKELREELENRGHRFRSRTDTEVLLHAYEEYGEDCVRRLNGMFAFALWDSRNRKLLCARDRLGIKPLYYYWNSDRLVFASEIKAILQDETVQRSINPLALKNYFNFAHSVAPDTIYKGIKKLLPGHYLVVQKGALTLSPYWDVPEGDEVTTTGSLEDYAEEVGFLIRDSVRSQMVSDVPVGVFLSGGMDSSTVVAFSSEFSSEPLKTFSVGFDGADYDELGDARAVSQHYHTDHHELIVGPEDARLVLEKLAWHYDEPFSDTAAIPLYILSRLAKKTVSVVLAGDGGDELFGGYRRYLAEQYSDRYHRWVPSFFRDLILRTTGRLPGMRDSKKLVRSMSVVDPVKRYTAWLSCFDSAAMQRLFSPEFLRYLSESNSKDVYGRYYRRFRSVANSCMYVDLKTWLPDAFLEKFDKATMAASLEGRVPLLDHRLVELAFRIPAQMKIKGSRSKIVLREAMRGHLPPRILQKRKIGFTAPMHRWFRRSLKNYIAEVLSDGLLDRTGFFNVRNIKALLRSHLRGTEVLDQQIYTLLFFVLWYRQYMDVRQ